MPVAAAGSDNVEALKKKIEQVGNQIRQMKATGVDKVSCIVCDWLSEFA